VLFDRATPNLGTFDLWRYDIARGVEQRITTDPFSEASGVWLPGGLIMFSGGTPPHLFRRNLGTGAEDEILHPPSFSLAEDISPDGRTFLFAQRTPKGNFDLWTLPLDSGGTPSPLMETPFDETSARFSRDGRHIAFASDESGRYEIYVAPFPHGEKIQVSAAGGNVPRWSRDGHELFYVSSDLHLVSVAVSTTPRLTIGASQRLFAVQRAQKWDDAKTFESWPDFDVSLDGKKFLAVVPQPANQQPLTAVLNWTAALAKP
jgi:Tol biopolymer transport system component